MKRCSGEARVTALYHGGNASMAVGNNAEAMGRYELLEREAPTHRLADDARLKGALAAQALGHGGRASSSMLERMGEAYPEGDMTTEGLFRLAQHRMGKGDWAGAVAPLEASRKLRPRERDYWGRRVGQNIFLGRALAATGDRERAAKLYREVIVDQPLSFDMAMAHARLAEGNAAQAAEALRKATEAPAGAAAAATPDLPQLRSAPALRAIELLRQGEPELARAEFTAAQLVGPGRRPSCSGRWRGCTGGVAGAGALDPEGQGVGLGSSTTRWGRGGHAGAGVPEALPRGGAAGGQAERDPGVAGLRDHAREESALPPGGGVGGAGLRAGRSSRWIRRRTWGRSWGCRSARRR